LDNQTLDSQTKARTQTAHGDHSARDNQQLQVGDYSTAHSTKLIKGDQQDQWDTPYSDSGYTHNSQPYMEDNDHDSLYNYHIVQAKIHSRRPRDKKTPPTARQSAYQTCDKIFESRNRLFAHLRQDHGQNRPSCYIVNLTPAKPTQVIISQVMPLHQQPTKIRLSHKTTYAIAKGSLSAKGPLFSFTPDTGANVTLVDSTFASKQAKIMRTLDKNANQLIKTIRPSITTLGAVTFQLYIPGTIHRQAAVASIPVKAYIIPYLRPTLLLRMDVLQPQGIDILSLTS
jgi:hypothetical protein